MKKRRPFRSTGLLHNRKLVDLDGKSLSCFTKYLEQNLRFKSEERG